ncbi:hypothetical protein [Calidifontibacter indicus]|uniref:hypothetical protein n=1 Tax=Calidifontibacter indicus TaxID=419650 RepID=UPI003D72BBC5
MGIAGRFPYNQLRFAETCLMHSFDFGLLDELRFLRDPTPASPTPSTGTTADGRRR